MKAVVDANVILHGRESAEFEEAVTVPEVMDEMESSEGARRFRNTDLDIYEAPEQELENVRQKSDEINSPTSDTDEKIVALALKKGWTVVSDDKAVQNLALHLEVDFRGYMEKEIEEKREWKLVCPDCGAEGISSPCPHCGSRNSVRKPC